ncbi:hypothetical protein N7456_007181 [Penicillium angulare]|uniref:Uncharacterized protein n=1 Tax=Penicillium angulare TaxID=116970 RepID=A0A9W9KCD6_9EURO|nr:hypothetical protein N7456_007181 [Penicillium angulare]
MPKLYYHQAPTFDTDPESAIAPKLGSIFRTLDRLTGPLNQFDYVSVPSYLLNRSATPDFNVAASDKVSTSVGLNTTIGQGIAGNIGLIYGFSRDKDKIYHCDLLETEELEADRKFVSDCINSSGPVKQVLEESLPGRRKVYMITGLKIATGFSVSVSKGVQHNPKIETSISAIPFGAPVEGGPGVDLSFSNSRAISHGPTANKIVFAYRVIKIKKRGDGDANFKYMSGGKYDLDDENDDESDEDGEENEPRDPWEIEPLDEENITTEFADSVKIEVVEGDRIGTSDR